MGGNKSVNVNSPKTARRVIPLFPELRIELQRLFESEASKGTEYVINRYRDSERANLRTQFARIVKVAGIEPIQKPFCNMRASRGTEIYTKFGPFLASEWMGYSAKTAMSHHLCITEADFERAVNGNQQTEPNQSE